MENQEITLYGIGTFNIYVGLLLKLAAALLAGTIIGLDRESRHKSAGLRTNILISVGAMIYTSTSLLNIFETGHGGPVDPNRVMAQIVSGIGFLGAGSIIQSKGSVVGLTTAASIWIVAALGAAAGSGYVIQALAFSLTVVIILKNSRYLTMLLPSYSKKKIYSLQLLSIGHVLDFLESNLEFDRFEIKEKHEQIIDQSKHLIVTNILIRDTPKNMIRISKKCRRIVNVEKVSFVHYRGFDSDDPDEEAD